MAILRHTDWGGFRKLIASQPVVVQFLEITFSNGPGAVLGPSALSPDSVAVEVPRRASFGADDGLAGQFANASDRDRCPARATVIPMYVMGFTEPALYAYLIFVYFLSALVHSNLHVSFGPLERFLVTPRFHHWHHGAEKQAVDINFAVHFPMLDRTFGTHFLPEDGRWPEGYGIHNHPVPKGSSASFCIRSAEPRRREELPRPLSEAVVRSEAARQEPRLLGLTPTNQDAHGVGISQPAIHRAASASDCSRSPSQRCLTRSSRRRTVRSEQPSRSAISDCFKPSMRS